MSNIWQHTSAFLSVMSVLAWRENNRMWNRCIWNSTAHIRPTTRVCCWLSGKGSEAYTNDCSIDINKVSIISKINPLNSLSQIINFCLAVPNYGPLLLYIPYGSLFVIKSLQLHDTHLDGAHLLIDDSDHVLTFVFWTCPHDLVYHSFCSS